MGPLELAQEIARFRYDLLRKGSGLELSWRVERMVNCGLCTFGRASALPHWLEPGL